MDSLPPKSRQKYMKSYENFMLWKRDKNIESLSETVLLIYFEELSKTLGASTLWAIYSMLKATIAIKEGINIKGYTRVTGFLKKKARGYQSKKSRVLTAENIETFLRDAPDEIYLATKVILIFGINGACRANEMTSIKTSDIETHNDVMLVNLPSSNANMDRSFVIRDNFFDIVKKYQNLRPDNMEHDRFFINYQLGKCTRQPIGRHKMAALPKTVAMFLKLPQPEKYTGHCFRSTSKSIGGWQSTRISKGYPEESEVKSSNETIESVNLDTFTSEEATRTLPCDESSESHSPLMIPINSSPPSPVGSENTKTTNIHIQGRRITLTFNNSPNARINLIFNK